MPVHPLNWQKLMFQATKDHVEDIGPKGLLCHNSSNDQDQKAKQRLKKYGNIISCYGENLSFGCDDAKEVLL